MNWTNSFFTGLVFASFATSSLFSQPLRFPTSNRALLEPGGGAKFYAPTPGEDWTHGKYGCTRTDGRQFHEGIDILRVGTDKRGEPIDPVLAAAAGSVAYVNARSSESNFGKYIVLRHDIEGIRIYTLYAHLNRIENGVKAGKSVQAGETIGLMGRTSNSKTRIARDRAHLHFEVTVVLNDQFARYHNSAYQGARNVHGLWNGRNLQGLDPADIFQRQAKEGRNFKLLNYIRYQPVMFRVLVRKPDFFYARFYRPLMRRNAAAEQAGIAGYEVAFNYAGVPCQLIPRSAAEFKSSAKYQLVDVDATEVQKHGCRGYVSRRGTNWTLSRGGTQLLDVLTYR